MKFIKSEYKNLFYITIGTLIMIIGVNLFLTPAGIYTTGILGLSQEISSVIDHFLGTGDLSPIIYWLLNVPIILLGWFKVGKKFTLRTFYAITLISLFSQFIPNDIVLISDQTLAVITSALFMGTGIGLTLKYGASTGGTDILAVYLSLTKGKAFGPFNLLLNSIVIVIAISLTRNFTIGVLMLISIYIIGLVIDKVHNSHEKISLFIVTSNPQAIRDAIFATTPHTCTIIDSIGGRDYHKSNIVMVTLSKAELYRFVEDIKAVDEKAWINVVPVENVVGYFENNFRKIL